MGLREALIQLKTENGLTTERLSQRSGVPKGTLNKLLNGETKNPTAATLRRLADALNCPVELLCADGDMPELRNAQDILPVRRRLLPMLGDIAAGAPIYAEEQYEMIACDDSLKCDFALRVRGDSMTGARIHDGDIVFIRVRTMWTTAKSPRCCSTTRPRSSASTTSRNGLQLLPMNPSYARWYSPSTNAIPSASSARPSASRAGCEHTQIFPNFTKIGA